MFLFSSLLFESPSSSSILSSLWMVNWEIFDFMSIWNQNRPYLTRCWLFNQSVTPDQIQTCKTASSSERNFSLLPGFPWITFSMHMAQTPSSQKLVRCRTNSCFITMLYVRACLCLSLFMDDSFKILYQFETFDFAGFFSSKRLFNVHKYKDRKELQIFDISRKRQNKINREKLRILRISPLERHSLNHLLILVSVSFCIFCKTLYFSEPSHDIWTVSTPFLSSVCD